ncbi:unnamed protein product [Cochlearia groenlandica]
MSVRHLSFKSLWSDGYFEKLVASLRPISYPTSSTAETSISTPIAVNFSVSLRFWDDEAASIELHIAKRFSCSVSSEFFGYVQFNRRCFIIPKSKINAEIQCDRG